MKIKFIIVALHPEGVDRNPQYGVIDRQQIVALHPEGVDRNAKMSYDVL